MNADVPDVVVKGGTVDKLLHRGNPQDLAEFVFYLTNNAPCAILLNNVANDKDVKLQKFIKRLSSKGYSVHINIGEYRRNQ